MTRDNMKLCTKCEQEKALSAFSADNRARDGLQFWCGSCHVKYSLSNRSKIARKKRIYYQSEENREQRRVNDRTPERREAQNRRNRENPERVKANRAVSYAIQTGELARSVFCEDCGLPKETEGHHEDYKKLLDVDWLCKGCHAIVHLPF